MTHGMGWKAYRKLWKQYHPDQNIKRARHGPNSWAIRNCCQDPLTLRQLLSNIVSHYKNEHSKCHQTSRCKINGNYEPSRVVVTDPKTEKMLRNAIESAVFFKSPEDSVLARDTSHVESFNNVMNVFQDKRTAFSDQTYNARAQLTVLHWNENVDRYHTSISDARDSRAPRRKQGKKNYKALSFRYRDSIWNPVSIWTLFFEDREEFETGDRSENRSFNCGYCLLPEKKNQKWDPLRAMKTFIRRKVGHTT